MNVCMYICLYVYVCIWGTAVAVAKVLCYNSEGRWFNPSWCHWNFSLT
jgi:hypothetical protein